MKKGDEMKLIVCLDENDGMMFNERRQSRDSEVIDDILEKLDGATLYVSSYSEPLFEDLEYEISEDFSEAGADDFCFVEDIDITDIVEETSTFIIYKWNREYPADEYFEVDLDLNGFVLESTEDFPGTSHDVITKEVWIRG